MPDGEVIIGEQTIGVFTIHFDETILISLKGDLDTHTHLRDVFEHAGENGMTVQLQMTPQIDD